MKIKLIKGDCLEVLKKGSSNAIDSLITDPPAGISFMGKGWDSDKGGRDHWIAWMQEVMAECYRVMKPGAHGLVWALPRTSHWTATALENAGFEVRDSILHLFGSGFPKSHNLEKATNGVAKGQGTALKPAVEIWWLIRKPLSEKTVAANVLMHGVGGINIDGCRIPIELSQENRAKYANTVQNTSGVDFKGNQVTRHGTPLYNLEAGRFPANLVLDEEAARLLDEQSGKLNGDSPNRKPRNNNPSKNLAMSGDNLGHVSHGHADSGGASRFFYVAKASKSDKGSNNTHPTVKSTKLMEYLITLITPEGGTVLDPFMGSGSTGVAAKNLGFSFVGIEREDEYHAIAELRVAQ